MRLLKGAQISSGDEVGGSLRRPDRDDSSVMERRVQETVEARSLRCSTLKSPICARWPAIGSMLDDADRRTGPIFDTKARLEPT